jgi:hypothetical protein
MQLLDDLLKEGVFEEDKRAVKSGLRKWHRRLREQSGRLREKCVRRYASVTRKRQRRVVKEVLSQFSA